MLMTLPTPTPATPEMQKKEEQNVWSALNLAFELGYMIAIPALVFGFAGAYADKAWGTGPYLMLAGFVLALLSSGLAIWRKIKKVIAPTQP
jgi:hypothetical protein